MPLNFDICFLCVCVCLKITRTYIHPPSFPCIFSRCHVNQNITLCLYFPAYPFPFFLNLAKNSILHVSSFHHLAQQKNPTPCPPPSPPLCSSSPYLLPCDMHLDTTHYTHPPWMCFVRVWLRWLFRKCVLLIVCVCVRVFNVCCVYSSSSVCSRIACVV